MSLIAPVSPALAGATLTLGAASASDTFQRLQGDSVLVVNNGSGGSINVTIVSHATPEAGESVSDLVVAVGAGAQKMIGPFPQQFEDENGLVTANFSATATVTRAVIDQS